MVARNSVRKDDPVCVTPFPRPRRYSFNIGDYRVAVRRRRQATANVGIWYHNDEVGYINLHQHYLDIRSVYSVDTHLKPEYQGLRIAYRTYEALVRLGNITIHTNCQSQGAIKLWRRFQANRHLAMYFVADHGNMKLLGCEIFPVTLGADKLVGENYDRATFDPYTTSGSLLLVHRNHAIDKLIQRHMELRRRTASLLRRYSRYDVIHL